MRRSVAAAGSAVFFLLAPGTVAGLIPWSLTHWRIRGPLAHLAPMRMTGLLLLVLGGIVVVRSFARFVIQGRGTPAPVAPTERLVTGGLCRARLILRMTGHTDERVSAGRPGNRVHHPVSG